MKPLTPCLWFDTQALDAANYYISIFPGSEIKNVSHYDESNPYGTPGKVMAVDFIIHGTPFMALNGWPDFKITPAISFVIPCKTQKEIDRYWEYLSAVPEAEQCGWVQDKFGVSWQIVPDALDNLLRQDSSGRVMKAMLSMKKLIIADLEKAYEGT